MRGEQAIFNLEIKKKSGWSINPDIHHSKVTSSGRIIICSRECTCSFKWISINTAFLKNFNKPTILQHFSPKN